nr:reverse transcriptase domain-containing protein [Tanacetum cinerariifolium]
ESKVRNSQSKSVVSQVKACDVNSNSSSEIAKLTHAVNQQMSAMTTAMTAILKQFQATTPPASVKAFDESFHEAWDRYKDLLRACPHHGFTELHQLDTFYNALNPTDQDSLNAPAGGNLLERRTQDV